MTRAELDALVAVWAHQPDDLAPDERAAVEALFAREPERRAEAEATRRLLDGVRALPSPPMPASLERAIAAAVDARAATPRSRLAALRAWLVRPATGLAIAVVAAGGFALWWARRSDPPRAPTTVVGAHTGDEGAGPMPAAIDLFRGAPATAGELADLDGLDERALERLSASLDDELGADAPRADDDSVFPEPDLGWIDELSPGEVESLERYLEQHRSPT
jgi:hypothetical protein